MRQIALDAVLFACYSTLMVRRSSAVEQLTVNQLVVGSIPTAGAKKPQKNKTIRQARASGFRRLLGFVTGFVTSFCGGAFAGFFCDSGTGSGHLRSLCAASEENRKSHAGDAGGQIACEGSGCAKQIFCPFMTRDFTRRSGQWLRQTITRPPRSIVQRITV